MITEAVILAAGMGQRLRGVLDDAPKGFLPVDGKALIVRSIEKLAACGIRRIVIVTGYRSDRYDELHAAYPGLVTVRNERFASTGSMYSLYCARERVSGDFLLLESDLLYEIRALQVLQQTGLDNAILLSGFTGSGDEVFVETDNGQLKNLSKKRADLAAVAGELVGISRVSLRLYRQMLSVAESMFARSERVEYEECFRETAKDFPVHCLKVDDLVWAEIDDVRHLQRVNRVILPLLAARELTPHSPSNAARGKGSSAP